MKKTLVALLIVCLACLMAAGCGKGQDPGKDKYVRFLDAKIDFLKSEECRLTAGTPVLGITLGKLADKAGYTNETELKEAEAKYNADSDIRDRLIAVRKLQAGLILP
jgi:hypothetical protein